MEYKRCFCPLPHHHYNSHHLRSPIPPNTFRPIDSVQSPQSIQDTVSSPVTQQLLASHNKPKLGIISISIKLWFMSNGAEGRRFSTRISNIKSDFCGCESYYDSVLRAVNDDDHTLRLIWLWSRTCVETRFRQLEQHRVTTLQQTILITVSWPGSPHSVPWSAQLQTQLHPWCQLSTTECHREESSLQNTEVVQQFWSESSGQSWCGENQEWIEDIRFLHPSSPDTMRYCTFSLLLKHFKCTIP